MDFLHPHHDVVGVGVQMEEKSKKQCDPNHSCKFMLLCILFCVQHV